VTECLRRTWDHGRRHGEGHYTLKNLNKYETALSRT
jgi:hypothetical protein